MLVNGGHMSRPSLKFYPNITLGTKRLKLRNTVTTGQIIIIPTSQKWTTKMFHAIIKQLLINK